MGGFGVLIAFSDSLQLGVGSGLGLGVSCGFPCVERLSPFLAEVVFPAHLPGDGFLCGLSVVSEGVPYMQGVFHIGVVLLGRVGFGPLELCAVGRAGHRSLGGDAPFFGRWGLNSSGPGTRPMRTLRLLFLPAGCSLPTGSSVVPSGPFAGGGRAGLEGPGSTERPVPLRFRGQPKRRRFLCLRLRQPGGVVGVGFPTRTPPPTRGVGWGHEGLCRHQSSDGHYLAFFIADGSAARIRGKHPLAPWYFVQHHARHEAGGSYWG